MQPFFTPPTAQQELTKLDGQSAADANNPQSADTVHPEPSAGVQANQQSTDVAPNQQMVVIGAGVIGLVTACRLQQQGHQVLLLDGKGVGHGCSFGNAGHLATEQIFPLADPALLPKLPGFLLDPLGPLAIRPRYLFKAIPFFLKFISQMRPSRRTANTAALKQLLQGAIPAWQQLVTDAGCVDLIKLEGSLLVFEQTELAEVEQVALAYAEQGVSLEVLQQHELAARYPGLTSNIRYAIWFKDVGQTVSPHQLNQALFQWFSRMGGRFLQQNVKKISTKHGLCLHLDNQVLSTAQLVVCAGVHSKTLVEQLGYKLPIEAERGYHLMTTPAQLPSLPVASFERKMIMTPMQEGLRLAGTVEFAGTKLADNWQRALRLRLHGDALWPALGDETINTAPLKNTAAKVVLPAVATAAEAKVKASSAVVSSMLQDANHLNTGHDQRTEATPADCWSGMRPTLPDSLPVISGCDVPGLWFHLGHQHLGLTLAASSSDLLLRLISRQPGAAALAAPFRLQRFG